MKTLSLIALLTLIFICPCYAEILTDQNPMILDTAEAISTDVLYITQAIWHLCETDGQLLIIKNESGGDVTGRAECVEGVSVKVWYDPVCLNGLYLDAIPSGELHIIVNERRSSFDKCKKYQLPMLP